MGEIFLNYGLGGERDDYQMPPRAVDHLRGLIGRQVTVLTKKEELHVPYPPTEDTRDLVTGTLVDVSPGELVIVRPQESDEGTVKEVLPVGAGSGYLGKDAFSTESDKIIPEGESLGRFDGVLQVVTEGETLFFHSPRPGIDTVRRRVIFEGTT